VVACSCSALTAVIGVGERLISEIKREPVTVTVSVSDPWACAPVVKATTLAAHISASLFSRRLFMVSPLDLFKLGPNYWKLAALPTENDSAIIFSSGGAATKTHCHKPLL
jgi:hypothetical protein